MSPGLADTVAAVLARPLDGLDQAQLMARAEEVRHAANALTGHLDELLAAVDRAGDGMVQTNPDTEHAALYVPTHVWWRDTATVSGGQAGRELRRSRILDRLPVLRQAVKDGRLSHAQASVLCRLDGKIPAADLEASQEQLVVAAASMNPEVLSKWVAHLIATHCEPDFEADQDRAFDQRYLQTSVQADGRLTGRFSLTAEDSEAFLTVLEPLARKQGLKDLRSAGQRRADALVEVMSGALQWMDLPQAGGQRPQLSYVIPSGWAVGDKGPSLQELLDAGLVTPLKVTGDGPWTPVHPQALEEHCATAAWSGPQTRARIETILCDARLERVLRDSIGQIQGLQSLRGDITPAQRRALVARDRHCIAKGCTRPPAFCDVHHLLGREDNGPTSIDNLVLLCRRHHVLWHRGKLTTDDLHLPWLHHPLPGYDPPLVA